MAPNVDFKLGEHVTFNGQKAVVSESHSYSDTVTIIVDGKEYSVNKNDLFGMNSRSNDYTDRQIAYYDKQIQENKEIIEEQNTLWAKAKEQIKGFRQQMAAILKDAGVGVGSLIHDENQKAQYYALREQKSDARSVQIRSTAEIMDAANDTATLAFNKRNASMFGLA